MIKTFRGQLADGGQDQIRLQTIKGKIGYRIVKFQLMPPEPGQVHAENTVKIYKTKQTTIDNNINFTDSDLLAAAYYQDREDDFVSSLDVIFDNEIFNQDIYVTGVGTTSGGQFVNYYIELEVIPLDDTGAEYTTLKDMRTS